jgi:polar amino acid transport system permease protein
MFAILDRYGSALFGGIAVTLQLALIIWIGGLALGTLLGIWRASSRRSANSSAVAILALVASSIPVLVYLLWSYYPLQSLMGISVSPFLTAAFVLTLYNALTISELVRGGIADFPSAYRTVARLNGVPDSIFRRRILLPLVFRSLLPAYLASQVTALHLTLFASLISVDELFRVTQQINAIEYNAVAVFSLLAIFYFILSFPLLLLAQWAERNVTPVGLDR